MYIEVIPAFFACRNLSTKTFRVLVLFSEIPLTHDNNRGRHCAARNL